MNADYYVIDDDQLPPWANGKVAAYMEVGAQLCTRDGRNLGNAVVISICEKYSKTFAEVVTDAGTTLMLTESELESLFYKPEWKMDPKRAPGVRLLAK